MLTARVLLSAVLLLGTAPLPAPAASSLEEHVVHALLSPDPRSAAEDVAALRQAGASSLAALDAVAARQDPRLQAAGWDTLYDAVGQCRGCRRTHLYWYTDLAAAEAAAQRSHRPIVSLRLLGRLTDEYSCANSRFFRTVLYADPVVADWLRAHVVLHWSSERPVPLVTIDFGDGRVLRTTVTGNSAHYVLDEEGRPIDVLPGLYGPQPFLRRLTEDVACAAQLQAHPQRRAELLVGFHRAAMERLQRGGTIAWVPDPHDRTVMAAEALTASKVVVEQPFLRAVAGLGGLGMSDPQARVLVVPAERVDRTWGVLGAASRAIVADQLARLRTLQGSAAPPLATLLDQVEARVAQDTALNEGRLHTQIHERFIAGEAGDFAALNTWVYAEVFRTPATDPWLGLLPLTFDGLTHGDLGAPVAAR